MHLRAAIRAIVVDILKEFVPAVEERVFKARVYPMDDQALPGICVFNSDETGQLGTTAGLPRSSERVLALTVQMYVKGSQDITDALAAISAQVENALGQFNSLGGIVLDIFLSAYEETLNGGQSDRGQAKKSGMGELTFQILYDVPENQVEIGPIDREVLVNGDFSGGFDENNIPLDHNLTGVITAEDYFLADEPNNRFGVVRGLANIGVQQTVLANGVLYRYTVDCESITEGAFRLRFGSDTTISFSSPGIKTGYVTSQGAVAFLDKVGNGTAWFNSWSIEKMS